MSNVLSSPIEKRHEEHEVLQPLHNEKKTVLVPERITNDQGLAAEFEIGSSMFSVVDVRQETETGALNSQKFEVNPDSNVEFLIVEIESFDKLAYPVLGLKGLRQGEAVKLGRKHLRDRFLYDHSVSRNHLEIGYREGQLIFEDTSTNGTRLALHDPFKATSERMGANETQENIRHEAPAYEAVASIFDDEIRRQVARLIENKFFSQEYGEIKRLLEEKQRLEKDFEKVADNVIDPVYREINDHINSITQHLTEAYGHKLYEYEDDVATLRSLQKSREEASDTYIIQDSGLARGMLEDVLTIGAVAEECRNGSVFINAEIFNNRFRHNPRLHLAIRGEAIDMSVEAIVSAEGFESWEEGRGSGRESLKDGRGSKEVIDDYATRETDIPPIDDLIIYVTPSGEYFAKTNNAHRVAAAKKKGDMSIGVKGGIDVVLVEAKPRLLESGALSRQ